ncbi:alpha/beta hydrolase-fold protein [uncultured Bifidobacterium sp.]|uniref:alpha/beta hydrolase n=1 Tax=uncultured Bifidobacterium sp. TaxID=165187 RepID=UPI0028DBCDB6|nr:alpha/beta hydrolase-fold protein [uncultured Bifidobacterium sp.]
MVAGRFGDALTVRHALRPPRSGTAAATRPMFLCLHGWGSNEHDMADLMRYIAPYNDFASLRAPLALEEDPRGGAYSWFHDCVPAGEDLDRDAFAAASAIDAWVTDNVPSDRDVVPLGFSQGGLLAVHLLRVHPERYRASVSLSGFLAPGRIEGSAPADSRLAERETPVFFGYGLSDTVIPKYELFAMSAWLDEHAWLTARSYHGLDHAVSLEEFSDVRQWLLDNDIAPGVL